MSLEAKAIWVIIWLLSFPTESYSKPCNQELLCNRAGHAHHITNVGLVAAADVAKVLVFWLTSPSNGPMTMGWDIQFRRFFSCVGSCSITGRWGSGRQPLIYPTKSRSYKRAYPAEDRSWSLLFFWFCFWSCLNWEIAIFWGLSRRRNVFWRDFLLIQIVRMVWESRSFQIEKSCWLFSQWNRWWACWDM